MLKEVEYEQDNVDMPLLDEQHLEHLNQVICESMELGIGVKIIYHENQRNHMIIGSIHYLDTLNRAIRIVNAQGWVSLPVEKIIEITLHDE